MELDGENPTPLCPGSDSNSNNLLEWEILGRQQVEEQAYLLELAGVDDLAQAETLQMIVNTTTSTLSHLGVLLPRLQDLNLSGSVIESVRDLGTGFRCLQILWLARCGLGSLDGMSSLPLLRELYASYNDISDLHPLDSCPELEVLDLEGNCVPEVDSVLVLQACTALQELTLSGNPLASAPNYRLALCTALTGLRSLDDLSTTDYAPPPASTSGDLHLSDGLPRSPAKCSTGTSGHAPAAASELAQAGSEDSDELMFVTQGIKHARVGVDSQVRQCAAYTLSSRHTPLMFSHASSLRISCPSHPPA
jgi:Leucine-rich repeat (LRR) protein